MIQMFSGVSSVPVPSMVPARSVSPAPVISSRARGRCDDVLTEEEEASIRAAMADFAILDDLRLRLAGQIAFRDRLIHTAARVISDGDLGSAPCAREDAVSQVMIVEREIQHTRDHLTDAVKLLRAHLRLLGNPAEEALLDDCCIRNLPLKQAAANAYLSVSGACKVQRRALIRLGSLLQKNPPARGYYPKLSSQSPVL